MSGADDPVTDPDGNPNSGSTNSSGLSRSEYLVIASVIASTFFVGFGGGVIFQSCRTWARCLASRRFSSASS